MGCCGGRIKRTGKVRTPSAKALKLREQRLAAKAQRQADREAARRAVSSVAPVNPPIEVQGEK